VSIKIRISIYGHSPWVHVIARQAKVFVSTAQMDYYNSG